MGEWCYQFALDATSLLNVICRRLTAMLSMRTNVYDGHLQSTCASGDRVLYRV